MSGITVTFLGCGGSAGMPQIGGADGGGEWGECDPNEPRNRRARPSILIQGPDGRRLLVDTGQDLRYQLTTHKVPKVDALVYTHAHADHVAGLDDIRILNRLIDAPMPSYALAETWAELRQRFEYAFRPFSGGFFYRPVIATHDVRPGEIVEINGLAVEMIGQDHGFLTSLGLRIGRFAYCTDVVRLDEAALARLHGLDMFVVDCFTRVDRHPTHANLEQVMEWVARLRPKQTLLTHMGPSMDYGWLTRNLPGGVAPAYDGMVLRMED